MKTDFEMFEVLQIYGSSMLKKMISFLLEQNSPVVIKKNLKNNCNTNCMIDISTNVKYIVRRKRW